MLIDCDSEDTSDLILLAKLLSIFDISLSIFGILSRDCDNDDTIDLMLSVKVLSGFLLSICAIFLSTSDTLSIDCFSENDVERMLSINLFCDIFLSIFDTSSIDCDNESAIDLIVFINLLGSSLLISDKLSTRFDNELCINLQLSINFSLYVTVLPLSCFFLIGAEKVMYFSVFSPRHSKLPLNSLANFLIIKL